MVDSVISAIMKLLFSRKLAAAAALLGLIAALPQGTAVVCLQEGGHATIESRASSTYSCHKGETELAPSATHSCACRDHCGPCSDSPLGSDKVELRLTRSERFPFSLIALTDFPPCLAAGLRSVACVPAATFAPPFPTDQARLSRAILLI